MMYGTPYGCLELTVHSMFDKYYIKDWFYRQFTKRHNFPTYLLQKVESYCNPTFSSKSPQQRYEDLEGTKFLFDEKEKEIWLIKKGIELYKQANKTKYEEMLAHNEEIKQKEIAILKITSMENCRPLETAANAKIAKENIEKRKNELEGHIRGLLLRKR